MAKRKATRGRKAPPGKKQERDPSVLTEREKKFAILYVELDNATEAYLQAGYRGSRETASANSMKLLRKDRVRLAVEEERRERFKLLEMSADRAMVLLGQRAAAEDIDVRDFFGEDGEMLKPREFPERVVKAIKSIEKKPWGYKVTLKDGLRALQIVAEAGGRIGKKGGDEGFDLAKYLDGAVERVKGAATA